MYGKAFLMMLAAGACSDPGSVPAAEVACSLVGKAQAIDGVGPDEACEIVRARVADGPGAVSVTIDLDLSRRGSAVARIRHPHGGEVRIFPEIAVDVMDRALRREDLERLGDAVAQALSSGPRL